MFQAGPLFLSFTREIIIDILIFFFFLLFQSLFAIIYKPCKKHIEKSQGRFRCDRSIVSGSPRFDDRKFQRGKIKSRWASSDFSFHLFFFFFFFGLFSFLSSLEEKRKEWRVEGEGAKVRVKIEREMKKKNVRSHFMLFFFPPLKLHDRRKSSTLVVFVIGAISSRRSCLLLVEKKTLTLILCSPSFFFFFFLSPRFSLAGWFFCFSLYCPSVFFYLFFPFFLNNGYVLFDITDQQDRVAFLARRLLTAETIVSSI